MCAFRSIFNYQISVNLLTAKIIPGRWNTCSGKDCCLGKSTFPMDQIVLFAKYKVSLEQIVNEKGPIGL